MAVLGVLAAGSLALTISTATNYIAATRAAALFGVVVDRVTFEAADPEGVLRVHVRFKNGSALPLQVTSARAIVYLDGKYVWGRNFDWLGEPLGLPPQSIRDTVLDVNVPDTKADIVTRGGKMWQVRASGLVEMPMLGSKLYVVRAEIPTEEDGG